MTTAPLLAKTVDVNTIPAAGLAFHIEANAAELPEIAKAYRLVAVSRLSGDLEVRRDIGRTIIVEGRVEADIVQSCVVTLEPVAQAIDEPVLVRFVESGTPDAPGTPRPGAEVHIDPGTELPEVLDGREIDLGVLLLEHFALAVDPYPRAPGAELPADLAEPRPDAMESPFAVLAKLAKGD